MEVQSLLDKMESVRHSTEKIIFSRYKNHEINFLVTGIGMVATAYFTAKTLCNNYDIAFNVGICGSFSKSLEIGSVINCVQEHFSELGAEDGEHFLSLKDLNLDGNSEIMNESIIKNNILELIPKVCGITVNTTHGEETSIEKVFQRFHPMIESMEGGAFLFACEQEKIPCAQIRAVSNYVERRNKENWNIPLAIKNVNEKMLKILNAF